MRRAITTSVSVSGNWLISLRSEPMLAESLGSQRAAADTRFGCRLACVRQRCDGSHDDIRALGDRLRQDLIPCGSARRPLGRGDHLVGLHSSRCVIPARAATATLAGNRRGGLAAGGRPIGLRLAVQALQVAEIAAFGCVDAGKVEVQGGGKDIRPEAAH